jgi:hypothetical protein
VSTENAPTTDGKKAGTTRRKVGIGAAAVGLIGLCTAGAILVTQASDSKDAPVARRNASGLDVRVSLEPKGRAISVSGKVASQAQADLVRSAAYAVDNNATIKVEAPAGVEALNAQNRSVNELVALMGTLPSRMSKASVLLNDTTMTVVGDARGRTAKADLARQFDRMTASGVYVRRKIAIPCEDVGLACLQRELVASLGGDSVTFLPETSGLTGSAYESIEDVAFLMQSHPGTKIVITGRGPTTALARERIDEVASVIVDHEVDPSRVSRRVAGRGESVNLSLLKV